MNDRIFVNRIQHVYCPLDDTVAHVILLVVLRLMRLVSNRRICRQGIVINTLAMNPIFFMRPEELNGVALTQIECVFGDLAKRFNNDMMREGTIAVVDDRIF